MTNAWDETQYRLRLLCGKPSPIKRFIAVLIIGGALAVANIYFVFTSIYNIGKEDAKMEYLKLQHLEALKLQQQKDSIQSIRNYESEIENYYEYEQQSNDRQ